MFKIGDPVCWRDGKFFLTGYVEAFGPIYCIIASVRDKMEIVETQKLSLHDLGD